MAHPPAPPGDGADVLARAEGSGVSYVDLQFSDVMGAVKTLTVPVEQLPGALEHGAWFDGSSVESLARTAESDMYLVPDPTTFRILPWAPATARLICWAHTPQGEPYPGDPRGALGRAAERARELGYEFRCGPEIEFFLLRRGEDGTMEALPHDRGGYFDFATDQSTTVRQAMVAALQALGIGVNAAHHEVAAGQHEVDLNHSAALASADDVVTLRYALHAVAQQAGLVASFMPKPFIGLNGSGMHVHQSLVGLGDGATAFFDERDEYGLSDVAKHFVAGQLHHAAGMTAVLAPLVNSYKRLVRGFEAPVVVSWARTNRAALVRVPHTTRRQSTRIELRSPDPSCNPYLAYAVMLRCGLDGIERRLPLPPPIEESLYGFDDIELERRNVGLLPDSLRDAVEALRHDDVILDALGDHLAERFVEAKSLEWRDYRSQVTPWELERYLESP